MLKASTHYTDYPPPVATRSTRSLGGASRYCTLPKGALEVVAAKISSLLYVETS